MSRLHTKYFGTIEFPPEAVVEFPLGLPGFEDQHRFVVIQQPVNAPLLFLQSLTNAEVCFVVLPARLVDPGYCVRLSAQESQLLGLPEGFQAGPSPEALCLCIVSFQEDGSVTVNLRAPVVIHCTTRLGVQAIPDESDYSYQHPLTCLSTEAPCS